MSNQSSFLEQELKAEIDERKDLMLRIKLLLKRTKLAQDKHLFLAYSIPIVYSIWEGFVKEAFQIYVRELNKLNLSIDEICDQIFIYHMESRFSQLKNNYPQDFKKKARLFSKLQIFYTAGRFDIHPEINTESNIDFKVMNRILEEFNLNTIPEHINSGDGYSFKDNLNNFLLKNRNAAAHGDRSMPVQEEDLMKAIALVEKLMDLVFERILDGFINERYRKTRI
jgi:hypothetical protein